MVAAVCADTIGEALALVGAGNVGTRKTSRRISRPSFSCGRDALAWLLEPISVDEFEQEFYERRLCLVTRSESNYYTSLLSVGDLDIVLGSHDVSPSDVTLVSNAEDIFRAAYTERSGRVDARKVGRYFDEGATVVFNRLHGRIPALRELCISVGQFFGSRLQTNIYLTPPNAQGFKPHWDTHDVFVLQVTGQKRWSIYDSKIRLPLRGQSFDPDRDAPGRVVDEFDLPSGSAVYIPRGLMHSARASNDGSLHITLGLISFTWTDFLLESVAAAALEEESLRQSLPLRFADESFSETTATEVVRERVDRVMAGAPWRDVWRHFRNELLATNTPLFTDVFGGRLAVGTITGDSRVVRRVGLVVALESHGEGCALRFCGQELKFPGRLLPAVQFVHRTESFVVRDLPDCLDEVGKVDFVTRLVREGILQRECEEGDECRG